MNLNAIGIDLGGTRIKAVILDQSGKLIHQQYSATQDGEGEGWKVALLVTVNELKTKLNGKKFVIGISAPGISNDDNTAIAHMPGRLDGLENLVWSELFQQQTWVLNDAVAALMAESRLGAAQKRKHAILLTLGTGVGGAILIDDKPYQGAFQKAGHLGHSSVNETGDCDITGIPGSLEDAIGNATVLKRSLGKYANTHELLEAYRKGDHFASWVWLTSVRKLAIGIASFTNILSPQCVVLAGGITEAGKDLFEPLETFLSLYEWRTGGNKTEILRAQFGDMAGATGAACFALEKLAALSE